jgi:hypothetical protein
MPGVAVIVATHKVLPNESQQTPLPTPARFSATRFAGSRLHVSTPCSVLPPPAAPPPFWCGAGRHLPARRTTDDPQCCCACCTCGHEQSTGTWVTNAAEDVSIAFQGMACAAVNRCGAMGAKAVEYWLTALQPMAYLRVDGSMSWPAQPHGRLGGVHSSLNVTTH